MTRSLILFSETAKVVERLLLLPSDRAPLTRA